MSGFQRLEQVVHVVVAKPIALTLYLIWLAAKYGWRWSRHGLSVAAKHGWRWMVQFGGWVRNRYAAHARKAVVRRSSAV